MDGAKEEQIETSSVQQCCLWQIWDIGLEKPLVCKRGFQLFMVIIPVYHNQFDHDCWWLKNAAHSTFNFEKPESKSCLSNSGNEPI